MSRIRTNTVRTYNAGSVTVENPSLTGVVRVNGVEVFAGQPMNGQALVYDSTSQRFRPATLAGDGTVVTQSRLRDLTDVAITTDGNGEPIIAEGAVLRFENYETGGVWIASDTIDGGSY